MPWILMAISSTFWRVFSLIFLKYWFIYSTRSIRGGVFPSRLKHKISFFKKEDRSNVKNYRRISILMVLSKIFEKIFMHNFLERTSFIRSNQLCALSTERALLNYCITFYKNLDKSYVKSLPQCSVLGPLLFFINVNSIFSQNLNGHLLAFTEDLAIAYRSNNCLDLFHFDLFILKCHMEISSKSKLTFSFLVLVQFLTWTALLTIFPS